MKKYLGLVAILAIATLSLATIARAEDGREGKNGQLRNQIGLNQGGENENDGEDQNEGSDDNEGSKLGGSGDIVGGAPATTANILTKEQSKQMKDQRLQKMKDGIEEMKVSRDVFKAKLETQRDNFKAEIDLKKAEIKKFSKEQKQELRDNANLMVSDGFEKNVTNIKDLATKITAKIAEFKAKGVDTTLAESAVADANIQLASATDTITKMKALIPTDGTKITPEIYAQVKTLAFNGKNFLKTAHLDLKNAVKNLKMSVESKGETTTTQ